MVECNNCGDEVSIESLHINYCLDCIECPECGFGREVGENGLTCSRCTAKKTHRILNESNVDDGDIVRCNRDDQVYRASIGPSHLVYLVSVDTTGTDNWDKMVDIRNVTPIDVNLRYEVRCADECVAPNPNDVDGVFYGFDDWHTARDAARAWSRAIDLAFAVWDTELNGFVHQNDDMPMVTKADPVMPNPMEPDEETKQEIWKERRPREHEYAQRYGY